MKKIAAPVFFSITVFLFMAASTGAADQTAPAASGPAAVEDLTTFSQSWLTISYPPNLKFKSEFRGESNHVEIEDPATRGHLFMYYQPLVNITYDRLYQARCDPDTPRFKGGSGTRVVRTGEHYLLPNARETLATMSNPQGVSCYWCLMAPVGGYALEISIMESAPTEAEALAAMGKWEEVIDSLKIEPAKAAFTPWDGVERFSWDGRSPAVFSFTFHPDFGFIAFHDSSAEPVWRFSDADFQQGIAKSKGSATFFMSDALSIPTTFHFNEPGPDPAEPVWADVVEGLMTLKSGELVFGAGTSPKVAAITLPRGVYEFRVYSGQVDTENDSQEVRFYFKMTEEKESNKIVVLKRSGR